MSYEHSVLTHKLNLFIRRPYAVRHNGFNVGVYIVVLSKQIVFVIGLAVERVIGAKKFDKIDFSLILRQVRLHGDAVSHLYLAQLLHKLIGAARNKARCENRLRILKFILYGVYPAKRGVC